MNWFSLLAAALGGGLAGQILTLLIGTRVSARHEFENWLRNERLRIFGELVELTSSPPRNDKYDDWPSEIRAVCQRIYLLYPSGYVPDPLYHTMERVFQLARALTLENISDLDQWKYEFRHEANNLRTELAKSLHTPTKRTHRRVRHVSLEEMHHARRRIINRNAQSGSAIGQDITDYEAEATYVYGLVERRGLQCWSQLFEPCDYNAFPGRSFWEAILNSHTAYFRNASVFEYGCGTGPLTNLLSGYVSSILATDINFTALRLAKHLCKAGNVRFEHLDFAKSQPCSKSFDVVVDNYVTQQIVDEAARDRLFSNVNRFLSPSGLYIFVVVISATEQDEISRLPLSDGLYSQRLHRTLSALRNELKRHQLCEVNAYSEGTRCCIVAKKHGPGTASP